MSARRGRSTVRDIDAAAAIAHLSAVDPRLAALIARVGPFARELLPAGSIFAALLRSIVHQQLHGRAAATIHGRVLALIAPHGPPCPEALGRVSDEALREAGLSRAKLAAVRDLAARTAAGSLPTLMEAVNLPDDVLVERLTTVRGIGPWSVHMFLIFVLGRPDVLPTGDFAVRLAFRRLYRRRREPTPAEIEHHARRWRPYRSVATWYLWRSLESAPAAEGRSP